MPCWKGMDADGRADRKLYKFSCSRIATIKMLDNQKVHDTIIK